MHELSVAQSLVELASEAARDAGASAVREVRLRVGALSCVDPGALEFCFELASRDSPLAGARLTYCRLPVRVYCSDCRREVELPGIQSFRCPECGRPSSDIRQGRELEIEALEIELPDDAPASVAAPESETEPVGKP